MSYPLNNSIIFSKNPDNSQLYEINIYCTHFIFSFEPYQCYQIFNPDHLNSLHHARIFNWNESLSLFNKNT